MLQLLQAGYHIVVADNLDNSSEESLRRVRKLSGCVEEALVFRELDLVDAAAVGAVFKEFPAIYSCVHFAGLKAVGESVAKPLRYYQNNLVGTLVLLEAMAAAGCKRIIFSSSATVYGDPETVPITEASRLTATNPYGRTKLFIEEMLRDLHASDPAWSILLLRYFNPVGAHESGEIGEDPHGIPNNLVPYIAQVAIGKREKLSIFGSDWPTPDGTGVRDYLHVEDLAAGHLAAQRKLEGVTLGEGGASDLGCTPVNLGTGTGYSVLEMVAAFGKACGKELAYALADRRSGDIATCYANPAFAKELLGWEATRTLDDMCSSAWRWQSQNPDGYGDA